MRLFVFGLGYTAARLAARARGEGWTVEGTGRAGTVAFGEAGAAIGGATHVLSSAPPGADGDAVLGRYADALAASGAWLGYLSSTGVYGGTGGAWVDESAPVGGGRRDARVAADLAWQAVRGDVHVFRLPGIYGPGRSAIERVRDGTARRVAAPGHVFSRVHVDDIVEAVVAAMTRPCPGVYNIADDEPDSGAAVIEAACDLLGAAYPPWVAPETLGPAARGFYAEQRRVANGKAKRVFGWRPRYPGYRSGLAACLNAV